MSSRKRTWEKVQGEVVVVSITHTFASNDQRGGAFCQGDQQRVDTENYIDDDDVGRPHSDDEEITLGYTNHLLSRTAARLQKADDA
jgi:hypothetical protein